MTQDTIAGALGAGSLTVSDAIARDNGSIWLVSARPVRVGSFSVVSREVIAQLRALRLVDSPALGTGHDPTTALCVEALEEILSVERPDSVLDLGTRSGILALAVLIMGVPQAVGLDIDAWARTPVHPVNWELVDNGRLDCKAFARSDTRFVCAVYLSAGSRNPVFSPIQSRNKSRAELVLQQER